jgi:peptide/nickel transport system substrate-binding protein
MRSSSVTLRGGVATLLVLCLGCGGGSRKETSSRGKEAPRPAGALVVQGIEGHRGGRYVATQRAEPKTWNSLVATEVSTTDITNGLLFESLVFFNHDTQENDPALAESWTISADGREWVFHLRQGLQWSDGTPLTSDDVLFTAKVLYDEKIHPSVSDLCRVAGQPFQFEKIDDQSFKVMLPSPYGPFLNALGAVYILPRHKLEAAYQAGTFESAYGVGSPPADIVTSGAWTVAEYVPQQKVVLHPNPYYYKFDATGHRLPYLDELVYVIVPDQNAELLKFQAGESDEFYFRAEDYAHMKDGEKAGNYTVHDLGMEMGTQFFWFNLNPGKNPASGKPYVDPAKLAIFQDLRFRQAVAHAVDRDAVSKTVYFGMGDPLYGPIPPVNKKWYCPDVRHYDFNLDEAGQILDAAGYKDRNKDGVRETAKGVPLAFTLICPSDNKERMAVATLLANDLAKIGIQCTPAPLEFNALTTKLGKTYDYEAAIMGLSGGIPPDPIMSQNVFKSSGRTHFWNPAQPKPATAWEAKIDSLMDAQVSMTDERSRKAAFDEVQRIVGDNLPMIYTVSRPGFLAVRNRFNGIQPTILRPWVLWRSEDVSVAAPGEHAALSRPQTSGRG